MTNTTYKIIGSNSGGSYYFTEYTLQDAKSQAGHFLRQSKRMKKRYAHVFIHTNEKTVARYSYDKKGVYYSSLRPEVS